MSLGIMFERPAMWLLAMPLVVLLGVAGWRQYQRGMLLSRVAGLVALRAVALSVLLCLAARPTRLAQSPANPSGPPVLVLIDRSQSMSLKEPDTTRYQRAVDFLSERLAPALQSAEFRVQNMMFDQVAEPGGMAQIAASRPVGKRTNLGGAIVQALTAQEKPLALIVLTDGIANDTSQDARAMDALTQSGVPFIGVGIGQDQPVQSLALQRVDAPPEVAPKSEFNLAAHLECMNLTQPAACDVVLFRDGQMAQKKIVTLSKESRAVVETFQLTEPAQGVHEYQVELLPPDLPGLQCACSRATCSVRVMDERELRILFVQGALTWDYKFISLALRGDRSIKVTGLTRTSKSSVFRQNIESETELLNGFPTTLDSLACFRVVVLSHLRPDDLSEEQQELLSRFCAELGGGVLLLGGPASFDASWQKTWLERLLPVKFSPASGPSGPEPEFEPRLTPEALAHPVFRLSSESTPEDSWRHLPAFTEFGLVDDAKLGAQVWMTHPSAFGPHGHRILMASQRYGSGLSAVICLQNFWRWRLAKQTAPENFDRFWRQLFRWLSDANRPQVRIDFADQGSAPPCDVEVLLQHPADLQTVARTNFQFLAEVRDGQKQLIRQSSVELGTSETVNFRFRAQRPGLYTVSVSDPVSGPLASRSIELRERDVEFEHTARNMETLSDWAALSGGLALKLEECPSAADLVTQIKAKVEKMRRQERSRRPVGLNGLTLSLVLGCLSAEWLLRRRWGLR